MTRSEASELVAGAGRLLPSQSVERLVEHTEGWPVGIYLAALSMEDEPNVDRAIERGFGDDRAVADYLREEFIEGRPAGEVDFLVRTSVLDQLSGPLCDAVLEREGSGQVLKELARSNLLIVPLDRRDRDYRYHTLLREMLHAELHRGGEKRKAALHARASRWYAEHGDADRAIDQAIAGDDRETAGAMIWAATLNYEAGGRHTTIRHWLDRYSEEEVARSAPLCLALAANVLSLGKGSQAAHWAQLAMEALKAASGADAVLLEDAARLLQTLGDARNGVVQMREEIAELRERMPEDGPYLSICDFLAGVSYHLTGDLQPARESLEEGCRRNDAALNIRLLSLAQLALLAVDEENLDDAGALIEQATGNLAHFGLDDYPTLALVLAVAALVQARQGRAEDAADNVGRAEVYLDGLDVSPWYEAEAHIVLARALLWLDDVAGARRQLAMAGGHLRGAADATVLREWLERAWQDADAASAVSGRWPLTPAELRLLHVLPTHLSFPEIAEQFFLSPNTVKTQARSIYRKLGVASRAEAVACGRAAGLLSGEDPRGAAPEGT